MTHLIFFISSLIQSLSGFGGGLIAVPLLSVFYEPKFIVPPFSLTMLILNTAMFFEGRKGIDRRKISMIVAGSVIGLPIGISILKHIDQNIIRLFISAVTLALGLIFLFSFKPEIKQNRLTFTAAGIISGFLSGSTAMGGPPLIFILMAMRLKKDAFRSTLIGCFAFNGIIANILFFFNGLFNAANLKIALTAFLPVAAGMLLGLKIKTRLSEKKFGKITVFIVVAIGIMGTVKALALLF